MDDDAVAAVEARVARIRAGASVSESLLPGAAADIQRVRNRPGWDRDLRARMAVGWLHWYRYEALPEGADAEDGDAALEALIPCFVAGMEPMPRGLLPGLAGGAFPVAAALLEQAMSAKGTDQVTAVTALYRRILAATPHDEVGNRAMTLAMLGTALQVLFERTGDLSVLDAAIQAGRQGADTIPAGHRAQLHTLVNLSGALKMRHDRTGAAAGRRDIDETIAVLRRAGALAEGATDRGVAANLCAALRARYDRYADPADLDAAIGVGRQGITAVPHGHHFRDGLLGNLGNALSARFALAADPADLRECIDLLAADVDALPVHSADRSTAMSNLAAGLWTQFGVTGADADLDRAIEILRVALADPPADLTVAALTASNLGVALWGRFRRSGAAADLDAAIDTGRQAVDALPADDVNMARFQSNLSAALRERYERNGDPKDIRAAVDAARTAVVATGPGHLDKARRLTNLGNALREKFSLTGLADDLAEAVEALSTAADLFPTDHPDRATPLSGLGNALRTTSGQAETTGQYDYAVKVLRDALRAVPVDSPDRSIHLFNLGKALQIRHRQAGPERASTASDRAEALALLSEVAGGATVAPYMRAQAANSAAALAAGGQPHDAAMLAETAVRLLSAIAPRRISRSDQERYLGDFAGLASDAVALALLDPGATPPAQRALALLEAGRGVLLSQALETRDDLADLAAPHRELAARYVHLRERLNRDTGDEPAETSENSGQAALRLERKAGARHRLAAEFEETADQIRALPGHSRFMLTPDLPDLLRQAGPSTMVAINVSQYRSDALVLSGGTVTSLPLPELTPGSVDAKTDLLEQVTNSHASGGGPTDAGNALSELLEWLWDAAAGPVLDHLGYTEVPAPGTALPRVWWMPGGLLSLLPVHAAGHHRERRGRTVLDRVVSSYTPTLRALGWARQRAASAPPERSLIVAMPTTPGPGVSPLPDVAREASQLSRILPDPVLLIEDPGSVGGHTPTRDAVVAALADSDIAHFACHAYSDPAEPSQGKLLLHDHEANPLTIGRLAAVQLSRAQLAYLSACETSRSASARLSDESVHLTSAFQLVGYRHVIGTLWPIQDRFAADIAGAFYRRLRAAPRPFATDGAARALSDAVRERRDGGASPLLWAAYLHAGA